VFLEVTSTDTESMPLSLASGADGRVWYVSKSGCVGVCGGRESVSEAELEDPPLQA